MEVGDSYGRAGGKIAGHKVDSNLTGRPTKSGNLDSWELSEAEPPIKEPTQAGPSYPAHM